MEDYLIELESIFKNSLDEKYQFEVSETNNKLAIKKIIDHEEQIMKVFCSLHITWVKAITNHTTCMHFCYSLPS